MKAPPGHDARPGRPAPTGNDEKSARSAAGNLPAMHDAVERARANALLWLAARDDIMEQVKEVEDLRAQRARDRD